ncbi:hypothetical protein C0J52_19319 [Blattella germanica]|nr:hypothetical protein C0J52_19319 [Blattella germanica]
MRLELIGYLIILLMIILRNLATLNINGINNKQKQTKLKYFINQNDIDILFLQEVNTTNLDFIGPKYDYVVNIGENNRGTAIIYRYGSKIEKYEYHPNGR